MYRQIHEKPKPFKPIIVTSIYVILIRFNLEIFISIIQNLCLLISSLILKQGKNCDVRFFCFCLWNYVRIISSFYLETNVLFSHYALLWQLVIQQHLNYW